MWKTLTAPCRPASGAEMAVHDEGYVYVTGGGIWHIALTDPLDTTVRQGG